MFATTHRFFCLHAQHTRKTKARAPSTAVGKMRWREHHLHKALHIISSRCDDRLAVAKLFLLKLFLLRWIMRLLPLKKLLEEEEEEEEEHWHWCLW